MRNILECRKLHKLLDIVAAYNSELATQIEQAVDQELDEQREWLTPSEPLVYTVTTSAEATSAKD